MFIAHYAKGSLMDAVVCFIVPFMLFNPFELKSHVQPRSSSMLQCALPSNQPCTLLSNNPK